MRDRPKGEVTDAGGAAELPGVRSVDDVGKLRAMADPIRLAILAALMRDAPRDFRVMTVKELAAELGEPQTKLYRHVKQLADTGLIRVASSRLVSGILEQRYQAAQSDLVFSRKLVREDTAAGAELITVLLARFRDGLLAARAAGSDTGGESSGQPHEDAFLGMTETRIPAARYDEFRARLEQVHKELDELSDDGPDSVPASLLIGLYKEDPPRAAPGS